MLIYIIYREIISDFMIKELENGKKIGGPGLTVEIDESLFGKLKGIITH